MDDESRVEVRHLDWAEFDGSKFLQTKADVIIGTDIVYERTLLPALSSVLRFVIHLAMQCGTILPIPIYSSSS